MDEIRLAGRRLRRSPSFTAIVVAILAAGIGVNTAMFSIVSGVLLRPLPFAAPEQLVSIGEARAGVVGDGLVSLPVYLSWREHERAVAVAGYSTGSWTLGGDEPIQVSGASVTGNFFAVLGVPLTLGRPFGAAEDDFGGSRSLILSHSLWHIAVRWRSSRDRAIARTRRRPLSGDRRCTSRFRLPQGRATVDSYPVEPGPRCRDDSDMEVPHRCRPSGQRRDCRARAQRARPHSPQRCRGIRIGARA